MTLGQKAVTASTAPSDAKKYPTVYCKNYPEYSATPNNTKQGSDTLSAMEI